MRTAKITVTMNGETHTGVGQAILTGDGAEICYTFWGETNLSFTTQGALLTRKGEMSFTLPLGSKTPQTVLLKTAYGEIPATVSTTRYLASFSDTLAKVMAKYVFSDGFTEQEFSFSLTARISEDI